MHIVYKYTMIILVNLILILTIVMKIIMLIVREYVHAWEGGGRRGWNMWGGWGGVNMWRGPKDAPELQQQTQDVNVEVSTNVK